MSKPDIETAPGATPAARRRMWRLISRFRLRTKRHRRGGVNFMPFSGAIMRFAWCPNEGMVPTKRGAKDYMARSEKRDRNASFPCHVTRARLLPVGEQW